MSERLPFGTIGKICRKSPPKTTIFPPKGRLFGMMSLRLLSRTGIANLECAVRPPGNSNEAIPLEATVQTILPLERIADDKVVQTNVLPVPPYP
ncbi:hypothetical protein JHK82_024682 [Glycine max]|nr:hypothetical protein JHK87_024642 [Glycine soja]KAG5006742.1 hypothetical protein JHK85_025284 [Glycine max]KAG5012524.1 hypothetical protein JHK86_024785 [Glycine max]KAG5133494.1 hypothetical protein JHK82_024682 [Glycine max]